MGEVLVSQGGMSKGKEERCRKIEVEVHLYRIFSRAEGPLT